MQNSPSSPCLLKKVEEQQFVAKEFGFYWETFSQLLQQIQNECKEVEEAYTEDDIDHLQEELGDLIQAAISLAVFCKFDPQETLLKSTHKFQQRYDLVVQLSQSEGHENLQKQPFERLMHYWNRAKIAAKTKDNKCQVSVQTPSHSLVKPESQIVDNKQLIILDSIDEEGGAEHLQCQMDV